MPVGDTLGETKKILQGRASVRKEKAWFSVRFFRLIIRRWSIPTFSDPLTYSCLPVIRSELVKHYIEWPRLVQNQPNLIISHNISERTMWVKVSLAWVVVRYQHKPVSYDHFLASSFWLDFLLSQKSRTGTNEFIITRIMSLLQLCTKSKKRQRIQFSMRLCWKRKARIQSFYHRGETSWTGRRMPTTQETYIYQLNTCPFHAMSLKKERARRYVFWLEIFI